MNGIALLRDLGAHPTFACISCVQCMRKIEKRMELLLWVLRVSCRHQKNDPQVFPIAKKRGMYPPDKLWSGESLVLIYSEFSIITLPFFPIVAKC